MHNHARRPSRGKNRSSRRNLAVYVWVGWSSSASSSMLRRMVNESLDTIRNWERSGGTLRVVHLSDIDALVDLCACTGERMDSLKIVGP